MHDVSLQKAKRPLQLERAVLSYQSPASARCTNDPRYTSLSEDMS